MVREFVRGFGHSFSWVRRIKVGAGNELCLQGAWPLDYKLVTYEGSPMRFRGPQIDLTKPFLLCLGGSETFGKFVPQPYPDR